jgi:hypothetical protein
LYRYTTVAVADTCVPLNTARPPQCGRVVHVKATDAERQRGLDAADRTFGRGGAGGAAAGLTDDSWGGGGGRDGGGGDGDGGDAKEAAAAKHAAAFAEHEAAVAAEALAMEAAAAAAAARAAAGDVVDPPPRDVWCTQTVPWLDPSAPARIGVGLDVANALAAVHGLELPVGGTVAHGGIDTSAVGVTRRGRAVLLTLGDAVLVAPKGSLPGGGGGGFCRPRSGRSGGSSGSGSEDGVGQDAGAWRSREERRMRALDEKIDIHALGGVLYRLMAGPGWTDPRLPAPHAAEDDADDAAAAADAVASDGTPSWARCGAGPGQPPGLSRACRLVSGLVARCWAREPADRPAAPEVVEQLQAVLGAIRNGAGGEGGVGGGFTSRTTDPYHHNIGGDGGGGTCLNEECGEVACPASAATAAAASGGQPIDSPQVQVVVQGQAASLVADVRACVQAGVMCTDLPKERRRRRRAELELLRTGTGGGGGGGGDKSSDDANHALAAEVRRVRGQHEGGGVGAGVRDVDLGKPTTSNGGGSAGNKHASGSVPGGVTAGGLSIIDNLDAVIGRAAPDDGIGSDAFSSDDSPHEGGGSLFT